MKQTAVEWFAEQMITKRRLTPELFEQAKQMEKDQIIAAHKTATLEAGFEYSADDWANQYYNQTFKLE